MMTNLNTFFSQQFLNRGGGSVSFEMSAANKTISGFYMVKNLPLKSVNTGTQNLTILIQNVWLISLNTMACLYKNPALFEAWDDPGKQLKWLETRLWEARNNTAQVIITGNVAPGNAMCNRQWSYRYNVLMEAF
jgi:hypothetical protein